MGGTVQRKQERNDVQKKGKGVGVWCNSATLVERTFLYYSLCVVCTHLCHVCMHVRKTCAKRKIIGVEEQVDTRGAVEERHQAF